MRSSAGRPSTPIWPHPSKRSAPWCWSAASACGPPGVTATRVGGAPPPAPAGVGPGLESERGVGNPPDALGTARGGPALETPRRTARHKSGKYTIERPLHVGAALAGRLDELA